MDRRTWLKIGGLSLGALCTGAAPNLARLLASERADREFSVILFWANGGPSHLETFDLKPEAPAEIRGEFWPIRTNVPGLDICEHFPRLAQMAEKYTILRNLFHTRGEHSGGTHRFLSGHASIAANLPNGEFPEIGSIVAKHLEHLQRPDLPVFVGNTQFYGGGPAYLGKAYAPFMLNANNPISASGNNAYDPIPIYPIENAEQGVQLAADSTLRLRDRSNLLDQIDGFRREVDRSGTLDTWDRHHRRAVEILASRRTRDAFDLAQEPTPIRQRYGDNHWGKSLLTCRRLVEAGVRFVQCQATYRLPAAISRTSNWDDHSVNAHIFDAMRIKLPILDRAMSALVEDLYARGLDQRVLFLFCGEFGRTPTIRNQDPSGRPGRDHWPRAMNVFVSGGGLRMGQVVGATNARGEHPVNRPMDSNNLLATIYQRFGIDPSDHLHDRTGRPIPILPRGEPIRELMGAYASSYHNCMNAGLIILILKIAVIAVTLLWIASLIALALGKTRLHGRINIVFFGLTLAALIGLEVIARIISPAIFDEYLEQHGAKTNLYIHLAFSLPSAALLFVMLFTGLKHRRKWHIATGILFGVLWTGTFVTGVFFLPHELP